MIYLNYKHPFYIDPCEYPDNFNWIVNRYMYLNKVELQNTMLDHDRMFFVERLWIERCRFDVIKKAFDLLFDQLDLSVRASEEKMPYMEVIYDP